MTTSAAINEKVAASGSFLNLTFVTNQCLTVRAS